MTAISLHLPDELARASQEAAHELGISRNHFIRQAIAHELKLIRSRQEQKAMAKALKLMETSADYISESREIDEDLNSNLPDEEDNWWKK